MIFARKIQTAVPLSRLAAGMMFCWYLHGQVAVRPIPLNPTPIQIEQAKRRDALLKRTSDLRTTLLLDRAVYLLGESIRMDITIENTNALSAEVLEPFRCDTGGIDVSILRGKEWKNLMSEPFGFGTSPDDPPVILLGGWQKISRSLRTSEKVGCFEAPKHIPSAGTYQARYSYGGRAVEFRVIEAQFKSLYHVPLEKPEIAVDFRTRKPRVNPQSGKNIEYPRELRLAVLFAEAKYYLVVTQIGRTLDGGVERLKEGDRLDYRGSGYFDPFVRITESDQPIVSVNAHADSEENLFVTWKTLDGESHSAVFDPSRKISGGGAIK